MDQHISKERLTAFVDNEVGESESATIRDHLRVCDECAAFVDEMQSLFSDLNELEPAPEEPELMADTLKLLRIAKRQPRFSQSRFLLQELKNSYRVISAGAIAAGLAIGILFGSIASMGLVADNPEDMYSSVVLQEDDQTIIDTYVAMIINDEQEY